MADPPRRGRRPGGPDTRSLIAEVARRRFLADHYPEVSLRSVADEAGVDVALIGYYFGSKQQLFVESLSEVGEPAQRMADAIAGGDLATVPARLLSRVLAAWGDDRGRIIRAIAAAAPQEEAIRQLYASSVEEGFVRQLAERIGGPEAEDLAMAVATVVSGVVYSRYLLRIEPLASMEPDRIIALIAPALTQILLGGEGPRSSL